MQDGARSHRQTLRNIAHRAMMRYGLALDLVGFVVISALVLVLGPLIF